MAQKNTSGCFIAAGIAVLIAALIPIGILSMFFTKKSTIQQKLVNEQHAIVRQHEAHANARHPQGGTLKFKSGHLPRFTPHEAGKPVSREQFVALMIDNHATALARETFQKSADQSPVKWFLRTSDISDRNGRLSGNFTLPYQIQSGNSNSSTSISIVCEFTEESRDSLLAIRRNDWVTVQGKLTFSSNNRSGVIKEARILDGSYAESPEGQ